MDESLVANDNQANSKFSDVGASVREGLNKTNTKKT
jgi:hypothetical protein